MAGKIEKSPFEKFFHESIKFTNDRRSSMGNKCAADLNEGLASNGVFRAIEHHRRR